MASNINADTTTGLQLTSDTSGNVSVQSDGSTVVAVTAPGVAVTGALSATGDITTPGVTIGATTVTATSFSGDGSSLTGIAGGFSNMQVFTSPGTWTNPGSVDKVKVTVVGGGGNGGAGVTGGNNQRGGAGGGGGGTAIEIIPFPTATNVPVTTGGASGTSSFGPYCSATGGAVGTTSPTGQPGTNINGGLGGAGSGGAVNFVGGDGDTGGTESGSGASSYVGGQGRAGGRITQGANASPGQPGGNYGGGGGGGQAYAPNPYTAPGGAGAPGVVIVEY